KAQASRGIRSVPGLAECRDEEHEEGRAEPRVESRVGESWPVRVQLGGTTDAGHEHTDRTGERSYVEVWAQCRTADNGATEQQERRRHREENDRTNVGAGDGVGRERQDRNEQPAQGDE